MVIPAPGLGRSPAGWLDERIASPAASTRPSPPIEVPPDIARDYAEAAASLVASPKASAALSRRCLQHLLRDGLSAKPQDLAKEIDDVLASGQLPSFLGDQLDAVRQIGNFAAHPTKALTTGEIVDVEPEEAEWNLDVLDALFDEIYVKPKKAAEQKAALNKKLVESGKPPLP